MSVHVNINTEKLRWHHGEDGSLSSCTTTIVAWR
jgi:hypothetical protein